jgi:hypothetical protein
MTTSFLRTGEEELGVMLVAEYTTDLVSRFLEWLTVFPLMTSVGVIVVEISPSLKALVKQTSSLDDEITGVQFVD